MKIEIHYQGINNTCDTIGLYTKNNLPFALISENKFFDILTDKQIKKWFKGKHIFNISKSKIIEYSDKIFHSNI